MPSGVIPQDDWKPWAEALRHHVRMLERADKREQEENEKKHMKGTNDMDFTRATELTPEVSASVDDAFEYHKWTEAQVSAGKDVREYLAAAVKCIIKNVPASPDRSAAIRKIREARMDCNSAITHGGKY